jgi:hypothetical protein
VPTGDGRPEAQGSEASDVLVTGGSIASDWDAGWRADGRGSGEGLASAESALFCGLGRPLDADETALARTLDQLYASEVSARVTFGEEGWTAAVGDDWNGFVEACAPVPLRVVLDWLPKAVCRAFPGSDYARRFVSP